MKKSPARTLRVGAIPVLVVLSCAAACSSPNREAPENTPVAESSEAQPAPVPPKPASPRPARTVAEDRPATPRETSIAAPAVSETTPPKATTKPPEAAPDPVKEVLQAEEKRLAYEENLKRLAAERDAAAAVVVQYEKDVLAFKNPFRPPAKLTPEQSAEIKGMDGVARVQWGERLIADAKAKLEAAQKAYDDAKANPPAD